MHLLFPIPILPKACFSSPCCCHHSLFAASSFFIFSSLQSFASILGHRAFFCTHLAQDSTWRSMLCILLLCRSFVFFIWIDGMMNFAQNISFRLMEWWYINVVRFLSLLLYFLGFAYVGICTKEPSSYIQHC